MSAPHVGPKTLSQIATERPFPQYATWWKMGATFSATMSEAILTEWSHLSGRGDFDQIGGYVSAYLEIVYHRKARPSLVDDFANKTFDLPIQSGEFDALSYAFYRSAFESIERHIDRYDEPLGRARRSFTRRVGKRFYNQVHNHLQFNLPAGLNNGHDFANLTACIRQLGVFLTGEGYLRDHFDFSFELDVMLDGQRIIQGEGDFLGHLERVGNAYALYDMGYPVILPSAVYLYHTIGEAQHHSSRTIEELFERLGYEARETDDFDPSDHPADSVVELWQIKKLP